MSEHINKSEIIRYFKENKKNHRLESNAFKEEFKKYMLDNKVGYHTMINALNIARGKEAISKKAYEKLIKVLDEDEEFLKKIEHIYSWNCEKFDKLMKDSKYDEEEIFLMIRNLYAAEEITQNDVEQYAYYTNQIVDDIKIDKKKNESNQTKRKITIIPELKEDSELLKKYGIF